MLADLCIGFPYFQAVKRIESVEASLVDALKQMSDTLKAGSTYESSLREIVVSGHGPLQTGFAQVVRKLEEGENFETAMKSFADSVDSTLVKRTVSLVVESVRSGAGLAEVLDDIAEDLRAMQRINRERKSSTLMQSMLLVTAAAFVAPLIFGFVSTILGVLSGAAAGSVPAEVLAQSVQATALISLLIEAYLFIEILATSVMVSLMREGRPGKSIIYLPILLFIAFGVYALSKALGKALIGGIV
ncbi:MAG TPA: type II secretion system F family protein [Candidatus Diapherotrites archaeon]|uniref:Type II secretion system F family protein n=1 Tax=Candidatus Iainarchaeum sp. TaxID=3101447 RepID=A0A7J4JLF6_9ARCH|nr:type II secretion system F family protein [Candidatus Diapherotrites archaeon]